MWLKFFVEDLLKKIMKKTMSRRAEDFLMKTTGRTSYMLLMRLRNFFSVFFDSYSTCLSVCELRGPIL